MRRGRLLLLVPALCLGACDVEVGSSGGAGWRGGSTLSGRFDSGPPVRTVCHDPSGPLDFHRRAPLPEPVNRILPRRGELLLVAASGLLRWDRVGWVRIAEGRDFAFAADTLARLRGDSLELLRWFGVAGSTRARAWPVRGHDSSMDVAGGIVYVHSPVDESGVMLHARSLRDGRVTAHLLAVERDFRALFLHDFDRLLEHASLVRAGDGWVALVPMMRGPISLFRPVARRRFDVYTSAREPGDVRTVRRTLVIDEPDCPTCTRRVHEGLASHYRRIHADATFHGRSLWVLGTRVPGSRRPIVYRVPLGSLSGVEAFRLADLDTPPRALAIVRDSLVVASEKALYWFELPRRAAGAPCDR